MRSFQRNALGSLNSATIGDLSFRQGPLYGHCNWLGINVRALLVVLFVFNLPPTYNARFQCTPHLNADQYHDQATAFLLEET